MVHTQVPLGAKYKSRCVDNIYMCEIGDLSTKYGKLHIGNGLKKPIKKVFVDTYLPLGGEHSIVGRSVTPC